MAEDVKLRKKLEKKYPNRIMQVEFTELAKDSNAVGEKIFDFTGTPRTPSIKKWLNSNTEAGGITRHNKNTSTIANAWMNKTSMHQLNQINTYCQEYYKEAKQNWPKQ